MPIWNSASYPFSCNSGLGSTGPTGATGATGPSISYVGGDTGAYNAATTTINTSATRINEHSFHVISTSNIFLFHYNIVLDSGVDNHQVTSTIGISSSASATAAASTNLYTGTTPVTLTGTNTDKYIAGTNGKVAADHSANLSGHATVTNLAAGTWYATVWAAGDGVMTLVDPKVNIVVLQIR